VAEAGTLAGRFRGVVFDLDGVVYLGDEVVPAAPAALDEVRGLGVRVAFVTNNSYRPPEVVTARLNRLGVKAAPSEVLTSAQATVRLLGGREGLDGVGVLVVGGPGLRQALEAAGARLVDGSDWRDAAVVVVGFDPELTYERVRTATLAIRAGARFVGSNPDTTLPMPEGLWPGGGATLALLQASTGVRPEVAGKPERALLDTAAAAVGPGPYLMVGDRADTDLDGAHRLGWATALVLSGVTRPVDLPDLAIAPDHLLADIAGLLDPPGPVIRPATPDEEAAAARLLACAPEIDGRRAGQRVTDAAGLASAPAAGGRPVGGGGADPPAAAEGPTSSQGEAAAVVPIAGSPAEPGLWGAGARLVAVDGDRVVGAVALRRAGGSGLLHGPVVERGWRSRLVGTRLVIAACIQARTAGLTRVVAPADAQAFLTRLGFHPASGSDPGAGGDGSEAESPVRSLVGPASESPPDAGDHRAEPEGERTVRLLVRDLRPAGGHRRS
jgi:glycerol-1-phosphatase